MNGNKFALSVNPKWGIVHSSAQKWLQAMPENKQRSKSAAAGQVGDASEDGDFVALRESREARTPESLELSSPILAQILDHPADANARGDLHRPHSGRNRKRTTVGGDALWAELTEAASSGPTTFREALNKIGSSQRLTSSRLLNPHNNQNVLHFALDLGDKEIIDIVVERADEDVIEQQFDVDVMKITGKKNALHQVVEQNNLELLKCLLNKVSSNTKRIKLLNQETRVEIKGQRPRTFPCLHLAAYYGFKGIVEFILDQGVDVNHLNAKNDSALLWAARWGHLDTVRTLLARKALPNLQNDKGSTALHWAVRYGHTSAVEILAREGRANVNQTRKLGLVAPIVLACALGLEKIVAILLEYGADPDFAIRGGEKPIHHAAREGFSNIIETLVEKGAEVDSEDERGDTALLLAAKYGKAKALQTLLTRGASASHKNHLGEDVWTHAVDSDNDLIIKLLVVHQRKQALEMETDNGPLAGTSDAGVNSLLFLAAKVGNAERMKLLFQMKVDPNASDEKGNNFLHFAAMYNQAHVIQEFHKKVNIDSANTFGNTALHEACFKGHHEVVRELIKVKAMANVKNSKGETALHLAAYSKSIQPHTVSKLMEYVIRTHPWECLNVKDNEGNNPLHIAAKHARPDVLWEFRFVRFKDVDVEGNIALHEAVRPGEPEVLEMMLDIYDAMKRDCDINHQNFEARTCLFLAAREGFLDSVKRLMLFGADISVADNQGNTPLHELTCLTVIYPNRKERYMAIIDAILERAPLWYCSTNNIKLNDHLDQFVVYKRAASLELISKITNKADLTVLDLACKVGANDVIERLLTMDDVTAFKSAKHTRYDITGITPRTNGTLGGVCAKATVLPRPSCLEWLLASGDTSPQNVVKALDIQPFSDIERAYGSVAAWAYAIIMIVHIVYMSLFSWAGLTLLTKSRTNPGERDADGATLVNYVMVPIEPALIILYNLYRLVKLCCMGEMSVRSKLTSGSAGAVLVMFLSVIVAVIYSIFVIIWIITYAVDYEYKEYFLSIALCLGWMFTIAFTRGFKVINYFWRLIQIMIIRDVLKFLFIYLFVLLAFSFAFHALFQVSTTVVDIYPNPAYTIFLMFNMMIGMEYVFEGDDVDNGLRAVSRDPVFMKILYILYMILATIVLLNLLIAMMNDSYQEILKKQQMSWRIESVQLGVDVEKSFPVTFPLFSKIKVIRGYICPEDNKNNVLRWYIEVPTFRSLLELTTMATEDEIEALSEIKSKMAAMDARMSEQIQGLKSSVDDIQTTLRNLEQALAARRTTE